MAAHGLTSQFVSFWGKGGGSGPWMQANINRAGMLVALISLIFSTAVGTAAADEVVGAVTTEVGSSGASESSRAEEKDLRFSQEVLEILRDKGEITEEQYEELKKKEQAEHDKDYSWKYSNGFQLKRNDGLFKLKFGGRAQLDFATIHPDNSLEAAVPAGRGEGVECRRCRIYFSGDLYDRFIFKSQFEFTTGEVVFADVYVGMKKLGPVGTVKFGHMKEPFSLEELTSSNDITFMERSLISFFDSDRSAGLMAQNHHLNTRLTWALGIFVPTGAQAEFFQDGTAHHLSGRMTGLPKYADDGEKLVHLGVSVSHQFLEDGSTLSYSQRPESHLALKYVSFSDSDVDDNNVPTTGNTLLAAELAWVHGPLSIQSEYKSVRAQDPVTREFSLFGGAYAYASYFVTGEHRSYKTMDGEFGRVTPNKRFDPANGGWGALELGARYSYLDLKDNIYNGGEEWDITVGVNWYLYSQFRIMANYVYAKVEDTGDLQRAAGAPTNANGRIDIFQLRASLEF
jgi:phosphate-selective porin OprO/OprP